MDQPTTFRSGDPVVWIDQHRNSAPVQREGKVLAVIPAGMRPDRERFAEAMKNADYARRRSVVSYVVESKGVQYWPYAWKLRHPEGATPTKPAERPKPDPTPKASAPTVRDAIQALEKIAKQHGDTLPFEKATPLLRASLPSADLIGDIGTVLA